MCSNNTTDPQDLINTIISNIEKYKKKEWLINYSEDKDIQNNIDEIIKKINSSYKKRSEWVMNYIYKD